MRKVNPRIELNLWLANHEVNLRVEQPALSVYFVVLSNHILFCAYTIVRQCLRHYVFMPSVRHCARVSLLVRL